jgi:hypothetical protein
MQNDFELQVAVRGGAIIVTLPGTQFYARYRKSDVPPWLVATDIRDDPNAPISRFAFHARAWSAANEKAKKLGWIVSVGFGRL